MKRLHADVLVTLALAALHPALEHALADRNIVETLLSPSRASSLAALALAALFLGSRLALFVVTPVYWSFRALRWAVEPRDTAPDRHSPLGLAIRALGTRRSRHGSTSP